MKRYQQTGRGLGSEIVFTFRYNSDSKAKAMFAALWAQAKAFESRFSRFLPDSELSAINQTAADQTTTVSPAFYSLLTRTKQLMESTDGVYSPFILPALQRAGYVGSWPTPDKAQSDTMFQARKGVATSKDLVLLDDNRIRIPADTALDFGGIGKGYLLDKLAQFLNTQHVKHYWLSLGGDIICSGFDTDNQPWRIGIAQADDSESLTGQVINNCGHPQAIATSGITKRKGPGWHHLIDPRTGEPAETDILTVTIIHDEATLADVYAKCLVIVGSQRANHLIEKLQIPAALIQRQVGSKLEVVRYGHGIS